MMKQKKWITYGLGLLVIGVWGIVLQRLFSAVDPGRESNSIEVVGARDSKARVPVLQPDTFALLLNYQDPFDAGEDAAGGVSIGPVVPATIQAVKPVQLLKNPLDEVVYLGYILNPQTKKKVAILHVGGREQMVQEGDLVNEIRLLRVAADEIRMSHEGKIKRIKSKP